MKRIAIIGGTGIGEFNGLKLVREHDLQTPYGQPSRPIQEGLLGKHSVFFLQRHGSPRTIPPHLINYRANMAALKALDITDIVAINAVGGISAGMQPGTLVFPDQIIDYTWGREHTVDEDTSGELMHIDFTAPYDQTLRQGLLAIARKQGIPHEATAVHAVTQGPRLETAAEISRLANDGCDVVGMTGMPEAALSREMGMAYASVCMVVNPAAGLGALPITLDMMREILQREAAVVGAVLNQFVLEYYGV
jgi:5'-methylthioinosine phosphorylase